MIKTIKIDNLKKMDKFAKKLSKLLCGDEVIILEGDLATGKTTFTKFLAKHLKISNQVNSPSFTIFKQYIGKKYNLNHFDFYRLDKIGNDFDLEEYYQDGITVIEWASNVLEFIPKENIKLEFKRISDDKREVKIIPTGVKYKKIAECIN